jgi:Uncharacterized alpha/beta hydrolase domain (DUF2235)
MGTSVVRELKEQELARMPQARHEMAAAGGQGCATKYTFLAAFDGTHNDRGNTKLAGDPEPTNIGKLAWQADKGGNQDSVVKNRYLPGVGTGGDQGGVVNAGVAPSAAIEAAALTAYREFNDSAFAYLKTNPGASSADIGAAAVGFSRGCPAAIRFAQLVNEKGLTGPDGKEIIAPGKVPITGLALIDPVDRFVKQPMDIPPNVQGQVLSVVAEHEQRSDFRAMSFGADPRVTEVRHPGNHVGVGGGYDKHGTAASVLEGVTAYFQQRGVRIADVAPENRHRPELPQKVYTEAYQTARNGDVLTDEQGKKMLSWRVDDAVTGRRRTQPLLSATVKATLRQAYTELAPGLKAQGLSPDQCLQVSAACTACAARNADWGSPERFMLSKDGERVAVQHVNGRFEELRVDQALERSTVSHLNDMKSSEHTLTSPLKDAAATRATTEPALDRAP